MASRLSYRTRSKLLKLLHGESAANSEEHELNAVFLQITLAIMLIFMITFFLFMEKPAAKSTGSTNSASSSISPGARNSPMRSTARPNATGSATALLRSCGSIPTAAGKATTWPESSATER